MAMQGTRTPLIQLVDEGGAIRVHGLGLCEVHRLVPATLVVLSVSHTFSDPGMCRGEECSAHGSEPPLGKAAMTKSHVLRSGPRQPSGSTDSDWPSGLQCSHPSERVEYDVHVARASIPPH